MRRRTRRRAQATVLAVGALAVLLRGWRPDLGPGLTPVIAYVHSDAWRAPLALAVAVVASVAAWRMRPARRAPSRPELTVLYRWWAGDDLLYVGISNHVARRVNQHAASKVWFHDATHISIEHYPTRAHALDAEERAIKRERPQHNVIHNGRRRAAYARTNRGEN